jgi:hypothetical protein
MTDTPSPDPLDPQRLAEAILAVERRVTALEEKRRARLIEVKRPRRADGRGAFDLSGRHQRGRGCGPGAEQG